MILFHNNNAFIYGLVLSYMKAFLFVCSSNLYLVACRKNFGTGDSFHLYFGVDIIG